MEKLGASFLHIINRLDLEIKQYFPETARNED